MSGLDTALDRLRVIPPHEGYQQGEDPVYRECACGDYVRADRTDLISEHHEPGGRHERLMLGLEQPPIL